MAESQIQLLASVTSAEEARLAAENGADIIDAKNPAAGALGALPPWTVSSIVAAIAGRCPVSATIGDLPSDPDRVATAVMETAHTGVDIVKIGLFPGDVPATIRRVGELNLRRCRRVGVVLADQGVDLMIIPLLARAGFAGVMLDTNDKNAGALGEVLPLRTIASFVRVAQASGLFAGLAGALRIPHIAEFARLNPDIMGFRGALCAEARRTSPLDPGAVRDVRAALDAAVASASTASTAELVAI